jgi:hypothetical protein
MSAQNESPRTCPGNALLQSREDRRVPIFSAIAESLALAAIIDRNGARGKHLQGLATWTSR